MLFSNEKCHFGSFGDSVLHLTSHINILHIVDKLSCCNHVEFLCECKQSKKCLRYRYTLDELPAMLHKLKVRAESYDNWAFKVKTALEATQDQKLGMISLYVQTGIPVPSVYGDSKIHLHDTNVALQIIRLIYIVTDLTDLKELITEAEEKKFPDSPLLQTLVSAVGEAEKCASVANQLVSAKVRTR